MLVLSALLLVGATADLKPAEIAKRTIPAVVVIKSRTPHGEGTASGFLVDPSGTIVTNLHVIEGAIALAVRLANGDIYDQVRVRAFDQRKDLAILQVTAFGLPTVPLGVSDNLSIGEPVVLIGNPLGLEASVSSGLISGIRDAGGFSVIQTDAAANPGNSGGPLLNSQGQVIGVLSFKLKGAESLNFVIPVNYVRALLASSGSFPLAELSERLGRSPDLFAAKPESSRLPEFWKSVRSGRRWRLRQDGEHIYAEFVPPPEKDAPGLGAQFSHEAVDFKKDGSVWSGIDVGWMVCDADGNRCNLPPNPMTLTSVGPTRIEGHGDLQRGGEWDCKKCRWKKQPTTTRDDFVWLPE